MTRRTFLLAPLAVAAGGLPVVAAGRQPNIVLIEASNWRGQAVPWNHQGRGDENIDAPNLARLASQGITFSRAYSCISSSRATACLRRGVFPHQLPGGDASLDELVGDAPTIRTILHEAGYRTTERFDGTQAEEVVSFVHENAKEPFCVEWVMANAASALLERVALAGIHLPGNASTPLEEKARLELSTFYARAKSRDREIGLVLAALDRPELAENTIVVFTSDHGEQYGSHGYFGDDYPYEECMRIPLAIRFPGKIAAGQQSDALISQADVMLTLLRLCGVNIPESAQGRDFSGLCLGKNAERADSIYAEGRLEHPDEWRMLVRGYDKMVTELDGKVTHLFNLAEDPFEMTNLANSSAAQLKQDSLIALQKVWARKLDDGMDDSGLRKR